MGGRTPYGGVRNGMAGGATPGLGVAGGYGTPMMNVASATPNPYGGGAYVVPDQLEDTPHHLLQVDLLRCPVHLP